MELQPEAAPAAADTPAPSDLPEKPDIQPMNPSEAARLLRSLRNKKSEDAAPEEAAPDSEIPSQEENAEVPIEEPTGETQEADPSEETPLGPPRSWSKEQHEYWNSLPRATQDYLLARDKEDSQAVRQAQNEAAEFRKAVEAERQQLAQVRHYFENQAALALQTLQSTGEFADIQTQADVDNLAKTDWPRWISYQNHTNKLQNLQAQHQWAVQQREAEQTQVWGSWAQEQDHAFREAVPEMSDKDKGMALMQNSISTLEKTGFSKNELQAWWNGQPMSIRDARWQQIMSKAAKWDESQAKSKQIAARKLPPVSTQRPGVAQPKGAQAEAAVKTLESKLKQSGNVKDAVRLLQARRSL